MTRFVLSLFCAVVCCAAALAAPALSPELESRVDAVFAQWDHPDTPGAVVGIIRNGTFVYRKGFGLANMEARQPNAATTVCRIYSMSKQITATCIALLAEEGKLSLSDDVHKYFPDMPDYGKPITLYELIHHTSGLRDYLSLVWLSDHRPDDYDNEAAVLPLLFAQKGLNFEPGTQYSYTNSGYLLLSLIVEKVSGEPIRQFADEHIFKPLGMMHAHYHDDYTEVVPDRAWGYFPKNDERTRWGISINNSNIVLGCGGIMSTLDDWARWDANFYHNRLPGGQALIDRMLTPAILPNGSSTYYGYGIGVGDYRGLRLISHAGAYRAHRSEWWQFPRQHFSIIVFCNSSEANTSQLCRQIADLFLSETYAANTEAQTIPADVKYVKVPEKRLEKYAGTYRNTVTGSIYRFRVEDGTFTVRTSVNQLALRAVDATTFIAPNAPERHLFRFAFQRQPDGSLYVHALYDGQRTWELEPLYVVRHSRRQLAEYVGRYYNEDLDVSYDIRRHGRGLVCEQAGYERELSPAPSTEKKPGDVFRGRPGRNEFAFTRDAHGSVVGFTMDTSRAKHLKFVREAGKDS